MNMKHKNISEEDQFSTKCELSNKLSVGQCVWSVEARPAKESYQSPGFSGRKEK